MHIVRYNISLLVQVAGENNTAMHGLVSALGSISFKGIDKNLGVFKARQRSCGKVMFHSVHYPLCIRPHCAAPPLPHRLGMWGPPGLSPSSRHGTWEPLTLTSMLVTPGSHRWRHV